MEQTQEQLTVGKQFSTHQEVVEYFKEYQNRNFVQLWTSRSRTVENAKNKKGVTRFISEKLHYYEILYRCIHGGTRKSRSTGQRPTQRSYRQDCPFKIWLKVSTDGKFLEVVDFTDNHNHLHTKEAFLLYPNQRQLEAPAKELAKHVLKLRANKKLVQAELLPSSKVTLKDLHNLASTSTKKADSLESVLHYLMSKENNTVEIVANDENVMLGLFYQDSEMSRIFSCYPEMLFVDGIYKVSNLRVPLYIFAVEDSNGESEIVSFFLAISEDSTTITKMVQIFKKYNPSWDKTKTIMTDKDFQERNSFKSEFPKATLLICLFHTLRTFRREVTTEKMGITSGERDMFLELFQKAAYARNEEEYSSIYSDIRATGVESVIQYYERNWHTIRNEWVVSLQNTVTYGNRTNNRLESLNSKVVQVVKKHSNLTELFESLDILLLSLRNERDNRTAQTHLKVPLNITVTCADQKQYLNVLTAYAYGVVAEKFKSKDRVSVNDDVNKEVVEVVSSSGCYKVSADECNCPFFVSMELPCQHILKIRELKGLNLFCNTLFSERWTKNYHISNSRLINEAGHNDSSCTISTVTNSKPPRVLSQHEKFRIVLQKTQKLASLASEVPSRLFPQRLKAIDKLIALWEENIEAHVSAIDESSTDSTEATVLCSEIMTAEEVESQPVEMADERNTETENTSQQLNDILISDTYVTVPLSSVTSSSLLPLSESIQDSALPSSTVLLRTVNENPEFDYMHELPLLMSSENISQPSHPSLSIIDGISTATPLTVCDTFSSDVNLSNTHTVELQEISNKPGSAQSSTVAYNSLIESLPSLPPKIKKRGRPKGCDKTAIGLPMKKRSISRVVAFERKHPRVKDELMLGWFISKQDAKRAVNGCIVNESDVVQNPNLLSSACLDEVVNLSRIQRYFTADAWVAVQHIFNIKKKNPLWLCPTCKQDCANNNSVCCNSCLEWFHFQCVNLKTTPRRNQWFCRMCHAE